jgi:hypothetical protein
MKLSTIDLLEELKFSDLGHTISKVFSMVDSTEKSFPEEQLILVATVLPTDVWVLVGARFSAPGVRFD